MLKGIYQHFFSQETPLEVIFEKSKKAGFDAVELALNRPGMQGVTPETTAKEARQIKQLADHHGLQLRSFMFAGGMFGARDASVREKGVELFRRQLEVAEALGVDTMLVVPGRVDAEHRYDEVYKRSQEELSKLVPDVENSRIHLAVENVWNNFLLSPLEFARYVDELNSPYVGVYFDVGNILKYGLPEHWIRILDHRIRKVHLKDFKVRPGGHEGFVPLLAGDVNWTEVMKALRDIGYNDVLTAEVAPYTHIPEQSLYDLARHIDVIITGEPK